MIVTWISIYKAVMAWRDLYKGGARAVAWLAHQPDEVAEEPFIDVFRALLVKEDWWLLLGLLLVPFMVLEMWGN